MPSLLQWLQAALVVLAWVVLCVLCLRRAGGGAATQRSGAATLVAYASQGGTAQALASQHARLLSRQGPVALLPLNRVGGGELDAARVALFIVSTYGEGEPPDNGLRFARQWLRAAAGVAGERRASFQRLHFAVLALGDREYRNFCGFGLAVDAGLRALGATAMFAPVTVDRMDPAALGSWQSQLRESTVLEAGETLLEAAAREHLLPCTLRSRECLNSGSPGGPVHHLRIAVPTGTCWQAGDIAVLRVPGEADTAVQQREYSIASLPEDGSLDLVVRQVCKPGGELGIGSGWLTARLAPGEHLELSLRDNPSFHPPSAARPLLLVGNGTGIAGLRAHLRARERVSAQANWLIFGERSRRADRLFDAEILRWQQQGHLEVLHRVYSREGEPQCYVQDVLAAELARLRAWLERGAAIYVCGSQQGMAPAVHRLLLDLLGEQELEGLILAGRYRRDVY
ncbi:MAG: sulfite reductase subunit alpha [Parahaliea sp.]